MGLLAGCILVAAPEVLPYLGGVFSFSPPRDRRSQPLGLRAASSLSRTGLSAKDTVYNLYATVYIHELSGSDWDTWNRKMRKQLVESQIKVGDEAGSWWNPDDVHAAKGGRLFQTAINTLMLEVYY